MNFAKNQTERSMKAISAARAARNEWSTSKNFSWNSFYRIVAASVKVTNESRKFYVWLESRIAKDEDRALYEKVAVEQAVLAEELSQDKLYRKKLWTWTRSESFKKLSDDQKMCVKVDLATTETSKLPKYKRDRLLELSAKQEELESQFNKNLKRDEELFGVHVKKLGTLKVLPKSIRQAARLKALSVGWGGWLFDVSNTNYKAFIKNTTIDPEIKSTMIKERMKVGIIGSGMDSNKDVLAKISEVRREEAVLNGKSNYGKYAWATNVLSTPQKMKNFLNRVEQDVTSSEIKIDAKIKEQYASLSCAASKGKAALFELWNKWFNIEVEIVKPLSWLPDTERFFLKKDGLGIGYVSLDLYARSSKSELDGPFMVDLTARHEMTHGVIKLPESFVSMNSKKVWRHDDVLTFFHEMGHVLHHLSCDSDLDAVGYSAIEADAMEWPSMFMQEWGWDSEVVESVFGKDAVKICKAVKHFETTEVLKFGVGLATMDMEMHCGKNKSSDDPIKWFGAVQRTSASASKLMKNDWARWGHLSMMRGTYAGYLYGQRLAVCMHKKLHNADKEKWDTLWEKVFQKGGRAYSVAALNEWSPGICKRAIG